MEKFVDRTEKRYYICNAFVNAEHISHRFYGIIICANLSIYIFNSKLKQMRMETGAGKALRKNLQIREHSKVFGEIIASHRINGDVFIGCQGLLIRSIFGFRRIVLQKGDSFVNTKNRKTLMRGLK